MGCDGGTIPRRDELVRVKKKPEMKDKDSELAFQWRCCAITQQTLQEPIVMCGLGRLYTKVSLIEALLNKELLPESAKHIKSLKDVKNLNLTPNPIFKSDEDKKGDSTETNSAPYICPVIGLEMSGKFRFVGLWSCGCVFSERALKEVPTTTCHKCQKSFEPEDVIILNGNETDIEALKVRLENRQNENKKKRKMKMALNEKTKITVKEENPGPSTQESVNQNSNKVVATKRSGTIDGTQNSSNPKKSKKDYSVAKDPDVSDVYKSLFTTHKSEKEQNRAHWITYNPFYN